MFTKILKAINPAAWMTATDRWMARMDYQGRHWAAEAAT